MREYIDKNSLLEDIRNLAPDASDYDGDVEVENQDDFDKSTYWAARDMYDEIVALIESTIPAMVYLPEMEIKNVKNNET